METPTPPYSGARTAIIGEYTTIPKMGVREFKFLKEFGPYAENYRKVSSKIDTALQPMANEITETIWGDDSYIFDRPDQSEVRSPSIDRREIITKLSKHLISPSIVTGDVSQLDILQATADEIPSAMMTSFNRTNASSRTNEVLPEFNRYYIFAGQLRLGRELATVACGLAVTPELRVPSYNGDQSPSARILDLRYQLANFAKKDRADLRIWQDSIAEARKREAIARTRPIDGGLMNPR